MHTFIKLWVLIFSCVGLPLSAMSPAAPAIDPAAAPANPRKRFDPQPQQANKRLCTQAPAPIAPQDRDVIMLLDTDNENPQSSSIFLTNTLAVAIHQKAAPIIVSANVLKNFLVRQNRQVTRAVPIVRNAFAKALNSLNVPSNCAINNAIRDIRHALYTGALTEKSPQGYPESVSTTAKDNLKKQNERFLETPGITDNAYTFVEFSANSWRIFKHNTQDLYLLYPQNIPNQNMPGFNLPSMHEMPFPGLLPLLQHNNQACDWDVNTLKSFFIVDRTIVRWHLYLAGHGSGPGVARNHRYRHEEIMIAGLGLDAFKDLLAFLHAQLNTAFLYYTSCNSGGYNLEQVRQHMEQLQPTTAWPAFTLAVGSLTDASSFSIMFDLWMFHVANNTLVFDPYINFNEFFNGLHTIFSAETPHNPNQFRHVLRSIILRENIAQDDDFIYDTPSVLVPAATIFRIVTVDSGAEHIDPTQTLGNQQVVIRDKQALILDTDILTRPLYLDQETMPLLISATTTGTHIITSIDSSQITLEEFLLQAFGQQKAPVTPKKFTIQRLDCKNYAESNLPPHHTGGFRLKELIISKKKGANEPWKATILRRGREFEAYFNSETNYITWRCPELDRQLLAALAANNYQQVEYLLTSGAHADTHVLAHSFDPNTWAHAQNLSLDQDYAYNALLPDVDPALVPERLRMLSDEPRSISLMLFAIIANNQQFVQILLAHNPDLWSEDRAGLTALHIAALSGNVAIAQLLLHHDQQLINIQDEAGDTPLHKILKQLIQCERGHTAIATTELPPTPYIVLSAQKQSLETFFNFLRNNGAPFDQANNAGKTPAQLLLELNTLRQAQQPQPVHP